MSASIFHQGSSKLVIGRGYEHNPTSSVDKSFLFKARLVRANKFQLDKTPFIKLRGAEVEISDPSVVTNPKWNQGQPVVLYSVGTPLGNNVTTDIALSPLESPASRTVLIDATKLNWWNKDIDKVKEPEVLGDHFFYEFADGYHSRIAAAKISERGKVINHCLFLDLRHGSWDSDHVSTGPIIPLSSGRAVMVYNGCRDLVWSIGLLIFDTESLRIISRSHKPLITPSYQVGPHNQRISFASSAVVLTDKIQLYYHEADKSIKVATLSGPLLA